LAPPLGAWRRAFSFLEPVVEYYYKREGADKPPPQTNPTSIPWDSYPLAAFRPAPYWLCKPTCFLRNYFRPTGGLLLVDFQVGIRLKADEKVFLGDEISPPILAVCGDVGTGGETG